MHLPAVPHQAVLDLLRMCSSGHFAVPARNDIQQRDLGVITGRDRLDVQQYFLDRLGTIQRYQ
jgi:hypothetical protein